MLRYCEMCSKSELQTDAEVVSVVIDENMETDMCRPCIRIARSEMTIEVLED